MYLQYGQYSSCSTYVYLCGMSVCISVYGICGKGICVRKPSRDGSGAVVFFPRLHSHRALVCMYVSWRVCACINVHTTVCTCVSAYSYVCVDGSTHACAAAIIDWPVPIPQGRQDRPAIVTTVHETESRSRPSSVGNTCTPPGPAFVPLPRSRLLRTAGTKSLSSDAAPRPARERKKVVLLGTRDSLGARRKELGAPPSLVAWEKRDPGGAAVSGDGHSVR